MPFNSDGTWTSPTTGKVYGPNDALPDPGTPDGTAVAADLQFMASKEGGSLGDFSGAYGRAGAGFSAIQRPDAATPNSPGAKLDTSAADAERARLAPLLAQLQQQAASGGGAWEQQLKDATAKSAATAAALGQSRPGASYGSSLHNIGNAQAAVAQRAIGQGNILREKSKTAAQDKLAALTSGMEGQDISQAQGAADAKYGVKALNAASDAQYGRDVASRSEQGSNDLGKLYSASAQAGMGGMSDGGPVPGRPQMFGDDEANDTVPAMLSPGEIVIPRSHAGSPEAAAEFVRSLHAARRGGVQHFADGGMPGDSDPFGGGWDISTGTEAARQRRGAQVAANAPSAGNGGLLDTSTLDAGPRGAPGLRGVYAANADRLGARAAGAGPSVAPQENQTATDTTIGAAMQAMNQRGPQRAPQANVLQQVGVVQQGAAGASAATAAEEQAGGQDAFIKSVLAQRERELALAGGQQSAAWRNTMLNSNIALEQQSLLQSISNASATRTRNQLAGAGQAAAAYASAAGEDAPTSDDYARGSPADLHDANDMAHGGEVRAKSSAISRPPTTNKRRSGGVDVQAMDPVVTRRARDEDAQVEVTFPNEGDFPVVYRPFSGGGEVREDEESRVLDFLTSLRRRRAA